MRIVLKNRLDIEHQPRVVPDHPDLSLCPLFQDQKERECVCGVRIWQMLVVLRKFRSGPVRPLFRRFRRITNASAPTHIFPSSTASLDHPRDRGVRCRDKTGVHQQTS